MPYAAQSDLLQRMTLKELTQLTDDAGTGDPDATIVNAELEEASGIVDGYCRSRYVTPLQLSDIVTRVTRDIAVFQLWSRRPQRMSDTVRLRYDDAMALLKDVATGKAVLDQPVAATASQSVAAEAVTPTRSNLRFTDRKLEGFV